MGLLPGNSPPPIKNNITHAATIQTTPVNMMPTHTFDIGFISFSLQILVRAMNFLLEPNGWRYPLVGGMRQRHFTGINSKPRKVLENAQTPTSRVHAVLGGSFDRSLWS